MAIYRQVQTSFWTDTKVADDFTPEDRYFYLYLFTNPHTNLSGCYEIGVRQMSNETGYSRETIEKLIKRMSEVHCVIVYSQKTKEMLLLNWARYNWTRSDRFRKSLLTEFDHIKNDYFRRYLMDLYEGKNPSLNAVLSKKEDTVSVFSDTISENSDTVCANDITVTVTDTNTVTVNNINTTEGNTVKDIERVEVYKRVIDYLNSKTGRRYNHKSKAVRESINARMKDGYTEDDFYKVIDNKCHEWIGTEREQFLRPSTLFAPSHFDEYLNQGMVKRKPKNNDEKSEKMFADIDRWAEGGG